MVNVENLKKINAMAEELLKHKIASSREDAVKKAEEIIERGGQTMDNTNKQEEIPNEPVKQEQKEPGMTWQEAMAKNNEFIVKTIQDLKRRLAEVEKKVAGVRIVQQPTPQPKPQPAAPTESEDVIDLTKEAPKEQPQEQSKPEPQPEQQQSSHPKGGSTDPADVAIDKIFYYGNKK